MNWKEFFWATKQKTMLTIALFVLANVFFLPVLMPVLCEPCFALDKTLCPCSSPTTKFANIADTLGNSSFQGIDLSFEIVYIGFSFLASCIVFSFLKKEKK